MQAAGAEAALGELDERLGRAGSRDERVAAFEAAYQGVAEWRYQLAVEGRWTRPNASAEDVRARIGDGMLYRLSPTVGPREVGSPAYKLLTELEKVALDRLGGKDRLQNVVRLRDGRTVKGNLLRFEAAERDEATGEPKFRFAQDEVKTQTAGPEDREVLRRASFEALAELEAARAAGTADPRDPAQRQTFTDAAYFLVQGPEYRRGSDAIMRTFLVAAHTRVFDAAPVLPQAIDLDGMVRGQDGFNRVMQDQLRIAPTPTESRAATTAARAPQSRTTRSPDGLTR